MTTADFPGEGKSQTTGQTRRQTQGRTPEETAGPVIGSYGHGETLDLLAAARPDAIKAAAERLLDTLGDVAVLTNRTGLAMLPFTDTVKGTDFHLGEVLVSEAHIRLTDRGVDGYGAVVARDLEHAMAMAVIDASIAAGHRLAEIETFLDEERGVQDERDWLLLRKVEATRVVMETF